MHVAFLTCACLMVVGQPQPGTPAWFGQRGKVAIEAAKNGDDKEAMTVIDEMAKQAAQLQQNKDELTLLTEWKKGVCEFWLGDLTQAIKTMEAVEPKEKNSFFRHYMYVDLGDAYLDSGRAKKAEPCFQKGLDLTAEMEKQGAKRQFQPAELLRIKLQQARCRLNLADFEAAKQKLGAVEPAIFDNKIDEATDEQVAELQGEWQVLRSDADVYDRDLVSALKRLEKGQKLLENFPNGRKATYLRFTSLLRLSRDYWLLARHTDARARLELADRLVTSRKLYRAEVGRADLLNARAGQTIEEMQFALDDDLPADRVLSQLADAEKMLQAAKTQHDKLDRGPSTFTAAIAFNLAQVHELRGRLLAVSGRANEARDQFLEGKRQADTVVTQFRDVLQYTEQHDRMLEARLRRAWLNLRIDKNADAVTEGTDALAQFDKTHKKNDLDRGRYLHLLVEAEARLGNLESAAKYAQQHRQLVDDGLGTLVAGLSASEQIQFFRRWDTPGLNASLRLGIQRGKDEKLAAASVEWLINGKAKLAEVLAAQVKAVKQADRAVFDNFQKSVQRQLYLMYGRPASDTAGMQQDFLFEEAKKRDLVKDAARKHAPQAHWYTLPEVRSALGSDDLYVGIYCLRPTETSPRTYYAWTVSKQGPIHIVPLGDARTINALVRVFVREQEMAPLIAPGAEKVAEQDLRRKCLDELSRLVLAPIRKTADGKKHWIISPDGPLWSIPWAALVLPETQRYAIEELTFRYAITGQDLVPDRTPRSNLGAPLILGDPWFNYPGTDRVRLRQPGTDPLRIPWDRLEFSRQECDTVASIMESFRLKPTRMSGIVRKDQFATIAQAPRMVYLSTHAYSTLPAKVEVDDPLLSCALAFAGWNYLPEASNPALPGMMSGEELLSVDLRGTELVVLASCQTSSDALAYGQSPADLRHAFHLAGARSVVSALWAINDRSTLDVMEPFIEAICDPAADKPEALRLAQQQSIRYLRMYRDHTHPFYWAGFTISGS